MRQHAPGCWPAPTSGLPESWVWSQRRDSAAGDGQLRVQAILGTLSLTALPRGLQGPAASWGVVAGWPRSDVLSGSRGGPVGLRDAAGSLRPRARAAEEGAAQHGQASGRPPHKQGWAELVPAGKWGCHRMWLCLTGRRGLPASALGELGGNWGAETPPTTHQLSLCQRRSQSLLGTSQGPSQLPTPGP